MSFKSVLHLQPWYLNQKLMSAKTVTFQPGLFSMPSPTEQITESISQKFKFLLSIIQTRSWYGYKHGSDGGLQVDVIMTNI